MNRLKKTRRTKVKAKGSYKMYGLFAFLAGAYTRR